jgi:hypothetical protein
MYHHHRYHHHQLMQSVTWKLQWRKAMRLNSFLLSKPSIPYDGMVEIDCFDGINCRSGVSHLFDVATGDENDMAALMASSSRHHNRRATPSRVSSSQRSSPIDGDEPSSPPSSPESGSRIMMAPIEMTDKPSISTFSFLGGSSSNVVAPVPVIHLHDISLCFV